jgi:hypothetical protein
MSMNAFEVEAFEAVLAEVAKLAPDVLKLLRGRVDSMIAAHELGTREDAVRAVRAENDQVLDEMQRVATTKVNP